MQNVQKSTAWAFWSAKTKKENAKETNDDNDQTRKENAKVANDDNDR